MKQFAAVLLAISFFLGGRFLVKRLEARVNKLEKIYILLSDISSRIHYTADSLKDIFISVNLSQNYQNLPFVSACQKRLETGESFIVVWQSEISKRENVRDLKKEDISVLFSFGSSLGTTDVNGQISNCEVHKRLIDEKISVARSDYQKYSKSVSGIGTLAAIATIILLI